jgi:RNA polymerase sigma-70 factor (ECF subfamily)
MTAAEFEMKYDSVYQPLYGFAMRLTRNAEDARDLMQETALRAYDNISRFRPGTNFKAWISTILRNQFINTYRKKRTRNRVEAPVEDFMYVVENEQTRNLAHSNIMMDELNTLVEQLSDTYRIPFEMFYNGYHYKEIADHLDLPIGTVKSRLFFARQQLREGVRARYGTALA